ncbi:hypothetical protein EST38_g4494 [Candolleomyces aberdarensis]|uniref:Uncharacterized protein n=1 Tax=Candolleomyces aberdarensis TaxID=2316362 RepID=A0A4Q2DPH8_9AGAR|nr:hypothetical protein EST38_g4494 [Candolleomyces aberdarensis]
MAFKEPPPEESSAPPRPNFKEPPPEKESEEESSEEETDSDEEETDSDEEEEEEESSSAPAPKAPAAPAAKAPLVPPPPPPPLTTVIPPTPNKALVHGSGATSSSPSRNEFTESRSPSPSVNEDVVLGTGKATIRRAGSGDSQRGSISGGGITRGPRIAKGPRAPSGSVSNMVQSLNRQSMSGSPTPGAPRTPNRLPGSPVKRPSSVVGRTAASFQRRTMASDAEDDVVDRR